MAEPTQVGIDGAPVGYNTKFTVVGYGSHVVRTLAFSAVVQIVSSEAASAQGKSFYPHVVVEDGFSLSLVFLNWVEREATTKWIRDYMEKVTARQISHGAMTVEVPARRFVRKGVPTGTLTYGDAVSQIGRAYKLMISFTGSSQPLDPNQGSLFLSALTDKSVSDTFYPSGTQIAGAESLAGTLFDNPLDPATPVLNPVQQEATNAKVKRILSGG